MKSDDEAGVVPIGMALPAELSDDTRPLKSAAREAREEVLEAMRCSRGAATDVSRGTLGVVVVGAADGNLSIFMRRFLT